MRRRRRSGRRRAGRVAEHPACTSFVRRRCAATTPRSPTRWRCTTGRSRRRASSGSGCGRRRGCHRRPGRRGVRPGGRHGARRPLLPELVGQLRRERAGRSARRQRRGDRRHHRGRRPPHRTRGPQLRAEVAALAAALAADGVQPGDRVAAYMPHVAETVITFLAANAIGATFTSTSSDFGVGRRGRPLRADAADGAGRRRRLPLRRQGVRLPRPHRRGRARSCRRCGARSWSACCRTLPTCQRHPERRALGRLPRTATAACRSSSCACPATTPSTSSTRRAPPGSRSASPTARSACC